MKLLKTMKRKNFMFRLRERVVASGTGGLPGGPKRFLKTAKKTFEGGFCGRGFFIIFFALIPAK